MSTNAAPSNVISMRDFEREAPNEQSMQFDRLLRECRDLALSRLSKALGAMLDKLPELTPTSIPQMQDRESRDLFVRAKLCLTSQRMQVVEDFSTNFLTEFDEVCRGRRGDSDFSKNDLSSLELSLVDESDFEETLRLNEMAARLRRYCDEEVVALDQRMGVLIGDATLQGQANPLSPQGICNAYRQACRRLEPDGKVRLVLLKLFDDHVLDEIRSIYKDVNSLLVERSILPKIRYSAARRASALGAIPRVREDEGSGVDEMLPAQGAGAGEQDFFALLQGLMGGASARTVTMPGGAPMTVGGFPPILGGGAVGSLAPADLVRSLTRIQHGDVTAIGEDIPMAGALIDPGVTNVLRQLKSTSFASGMGQTEGMTLDIVIMLFDQIFDDSKIPSAMKGLIGRLQIPMLKVAILDKTFFSKKTHPARKFLDAMGELCLTVPEDFGSSSPLYAELDSIVQRLIDGFQEKVEVFDELRGELERVAGQEGQRTREASRQHAVEIEQRERLGLAKAVSEHAIKLRVETKKVPPVIVRFLTEQWVKLLIVAYAKHGADSDAYKAATSSMDLLVWSVSPMHTLDERRKLATQLPGLLKRLAYGMQLIGTGDDARKQFFAKLMRCHTKVMNGHHGTASQADAPGALNPVAEAVAATVAPAPVAVVVPILTDVAEPEPIAAPQPSATVNTGLPTGLDAEPASTAEVAQPEPHDDTELLEATATFSAVTIPNPFGEGEIEVEEIDLADLPDSPLVDLPRPTGSRNLSHTSDEHSRMVSDLAEGAWVEFRDGEDKVTHAQLSYISPLKGTYLFVTREGRKVGEYSLYQLAREFRTGKASPMNNVPLFDRAMSNLVGVLKQAD